VSVAINDKSTSLQEKDPGTTTRKAYLFEAAFEYFISITISGAFFTLLIKRMGVSDSLTGIISSIAYLSCTIEVYTASFMAKRRSIRNTILGIQCVQQSLYACLYLLPFLRLPVTVQVVLFAVIYLLGTSMASIVNTAKYSWLNSFVDPGQRGSFTARKEMTFLVTGILYNYILSRVIDHFTDIGKSETGLKICACLIFALMLLHTVALLFTRDAPQMLQDLQRTATLRATLKTNLGNPTFRKLLVVVAVWNLFACFSNAYYNVFMVGDMGCTVTFIALGSIGAGLARAAFSRPLGRYADRHGFAMSLQLGFLIAATSYLCMMFCTPAVGKVPYLLYVVIYAVSQATLNSSMLNVVFQYIPASDRMGAMGVYAAMGGIAGFSGSLLGGWVLAAVQKNANTLLGFPLYGQQLLSIISAVGVVWLLLYVRRVIAKLPRVE